MLPYLPAILNAEELEIPVAGEQVAQLVWLIASCIFSESYPALQIQVCKHLSPTQKKNKKSVRYKHSMVFSLCLEM